MARRPLFYEFFAGGGMARAGLAAHFDCAFANDIDARKAASYAANWGADHLRLGDIATLRPADLPGAADLAWASFPCQDLSLAGNGAGLAGARSGAFWPFWRLIEGLAAAGRAPPLVAVENVVGALTSAGGRDFSAIVEAMVAAGYSVGALVIDAARFVPQSRPRLFVVASRNAGRLAGLDAGRANADWHPPSLVRAAGRLSPAAKARWVWLSPPAPPPRPTRLADLVETDPSGVRWHAPGETERLLGLMAPAHRDRVEAARREGGRIVGAAFRRTRPSPPGGRVQRAEVRFDGLAGCLRTPAGGSSRQTLLVIEDGAVRSRLLSPREAARLMGLPDTYRLPPRISEALHLVGDGVVVPAVRFLATEILAPLLGGSVLAPSIRGLGRTTGPLGPAAFEGSGDPIRLSTGPGAGQG